MSEPISYEQAGVNIDIADATKREMAESIDSGDARIFNKVGAFASLVDGRFGGLNEPVLVLKTEEPGSKQKLAFKHGRVSSICYDLINHLINDIIVMGAEPLYVQDCIICGKIEPDVVKELVASMAAACSEQGCTLVGGETSEQPGVIEAGVYVLSASIVGVVDKGRIIDGSSITEGDVVLAVASNGLHTNGYSLVRALIDREPSILDRPVDGESFLDAIMRAHLCYWTAMRDLFGIPGLHGMAHITGGGIEGNLNRILPEGLAADVDVSRIRILPIFRHLRELGALEDDDMLKTFNMGVGLTIVAGTDAVETIQAHLRTHELDSYVIGRIVKGDRQVLLGGSLNWQSHSSRNDRGVIDAG